MYSFDRAYDGRTACVTGGAGFIGSHLVDALVRHGTTVRVLDDLSNGRRENLDEVADRIEFHEGSILDADAVERAVRGADVVFHLAAVASVPRSVAEPGLYHRIDCDGTLAILEACRSLDVPRIVSSSSSSVYGDQERLPKEETMTTAPVSPYAAAKAAAEQYVRAWSRCYGLHAVSLRYFNIFGSRQRPDSPYAAVIPRFAEALYEGRAPVIFGDGLQTRDFTFVDNAVHANLLAGATDRPLRGEAINIATGVRMTLLELLRAMARLLGVEAAPTLDPPRPGDVLHSFADTSAAHDLIGYEPIVSFEDGLRETVAWYVKLFAEGEEETSERRNVGTSK